MYIAADKIFYSILLRIYFLSFEVLTTFHTITNDVVVCTQKIKYMALYTLREEILPGIAFENK